ncbi:MAG: restriction endonuclease [Leptolyngbya sp. SIO1E4]|nr:restriction endonuclease [Leptolyngbya sp. SIO1E4]
MSIARHHTEWLSLVEASGPFISLQVLLEVFPTGLDAHDADLFRSLRSAYEEWLDYRSDLVIHRAWVNWVLTDQLEFPDEVLLSGQAVSPALKVTFSEHQLTLRPDWVVVDPESRQPHLLVQVVPPEQGLEKTYRNSRWKASPATGMMELLHATDVRLGLLTNGEQWMLVNAPRGESAGFISWYANLWLEEKLTLRAFRSLLGVRRFFAVDAGETLADLLARSKDAQQEVTDQLGFQVRKAVEVLVQSLDRIDQDRQRTLLQGLAETDLYQAALTVMMRLVFLFSAEERGLLLLGDPLYDQFYAVSTLRSQLRELADQAGEELLERRYDAWVRLLATFRAVHGGIHHDALQLPAYGGQLFDPDRFPFLEGRAPGTHWRDTPAAPIPINNRTVLHLLEALQLLQIKVGGTVEPRKLSFRALDIEQIGHVYEGLLDHTAVRAEATILGLEGTKNKEPEVALEELEQLHAKGEDDLLAFLKSETGRSVSALKKRIPPADLDEAAIGKDLDPHDLNQFLIACNNDPDLFKRVLPWAALMRCDTFGQPIVIPAGSVFVTQGTDRRETGTHYTPKSLTEEIVKYTLEPLIYDGVAAGKPKEEWRLKSAAELLALKVCDMAMGSGAFLVQVCRFLSERLVEAWEEAERLHLGQVVVAPEGTLSTSQPEECPIPKDADERLAVARRIVADRCLYGVDKNPMAVEMAKLSLWLITLQKNRPFTFLDHALRCGDSLLGVTSREQIEFLHLNPDNEAVQLRTVSDIWRPLLNRAIAKRKELESFTVNDIQDLARKEALQTEAEELTRNIKIAADYLIGEALAQAGKTGNLKVEDLGVLSGLVTNALEESDGRERENKLRQIWEKAQRMLNAGKPEGQPTREPFHWALEFPEVFLEEDAPQGFSAIVGNPPFQGGNKITGAVGTDYRDFLVEQVANGRRGSADLCSYFFLNSGKLVRVGGNFGLVATNTISQGDTREIGLDKLTASGFVIPRAASSRKWPGMAAVEVAYVWLRKGEWQREYHLDGKSVEGITSFLTVPGKAIGKPYRLRASQGSSFKGTEVNGMGFVLEIGEAQELIKKDAENRDVLFPYLNGQDLNSHFDQAPSRWVINFQDYPLDAQNDNPKKPKGAPYARDYSDCLAVLEERVKPERIAKIDGNATDRDTAKRWWQFKRPTMDLYEAIADCERVLAASRHNKMLLFEFVGPDIVFSEALVVFSLEKFSDLALLQSSIHDAWAWQNCSTIRDAGIRYSPTDGFETFPFPENTDTLETIGERYYTHRQTIMQTRQEGLTKTYNRFHDPTQTDPDIQTLRDLHMQMDNAVAAAYGWHDLLPSTSGRGAGGEGGLNHDFHETKQGLRFTISEAARREVLDRLLALNHQRYAEEVAQGLHDKKKKKGKSKKKTQVPKKSVVAEEKIIQGSLFPDL